MEYKKKHELMRREARATVVAAALVMAFWWAAGFGLSAVDFTVFYLPGWFAVGCFGSWVLAVALVVFLITRVFTDFSLDDDEAGGEGPSRQTGAKDMGRRGAEDSPGGKEGGLP
jgi:uncharacterized membrane protein YhdT